MLLFLSSICSSLIILNLISDLCILIPIVDTSLISHLDSTSSIPLPVHSILFQSSLVIGQLHHSLEVELEAMLLEVGVASMVEL